MNEWSRTRKRIIFSLVLLAIIVFVGLPVFLLFYEKPNCSDGRMNGDETGVDCGGSCQRLCTPEALPLILKGDPRVLFVAESASSTKAYEVIVLVENPNQNAEIYKADYEIKVYDTASPVPVKIIKNYTFVPKGKTFAVFEGPFILDALVVPSRATIEWRLTPLSWQKNEAVEPDIEINEISLSKASSTPRLDALVENHSLSAVSNLDFVALISDAEGNLFAASKTFIETIPSGGSAPIVFIWPRAFTKSAAQIEIIKRVFPDRSFIR